MNYDIYHGTIIINIEYLCMETRYKYSQSTDNTIKHEAHAFNLNN